MGRARVRLRERVRGCADMRVCGHVRIGFRGAALSLFAVKLPRGVAAISPGAPPLADMRTCGGAGMSAWE